MKTSRISMDINNTGQEQLEDELVASIDDDREKIDRFLQKCLEATTDQSGKSNALADTITGYLSQHGIRVVNVAPCKGQPTIVSLFAKSDGPSIIMNGVIDVETKPTRPSSHNRSSATPDIDKRKIATVAGTAATVVAYTHLHARQRQLHGTIVLTVVSNDETGDMRGCHYLLEEDERRELFLGDCVLNAEPTWINNVVVADTKHRSLAKHPLVRGIMRSANAVVGKMPVLVPPEHPTYSHVWSGLGIPTCSLGLPISPTSMNEQGEIAIEDFLSLVKIHALAACDYIMDEQ